MKMILMMICLLLLCGCKEEAIPWDSERLYVALEEASLKEGILFTEDLDDNGSPELYVITEKADGTGSDLYGFNGDGTSLGFIPMGLAADEIWRVYHTFNEEKGYLYLESRGYACAGDGEAPYTQHYITLKRKQLNSTDVLVNNIFGKTSYVIDGKTITDHKEHRKALDDYFLKDGENEQLAYESFDQENLKDTLDSINP